MKLLVLSLFLLLHTTAAASAQEATPYPTPQIQGLYDEELEDNQTATATAQLEEPAPTATPSARTTEYLDPTNAPVSGTFETSLLILTSGSLFIGLGYHFTKNN